MAMTDYRIAVVVFLIVASIGNWLVAKQRHDAIGYEPRTVAVHVSYATKPDAAIPSQPNSRYESNQREHVAIAGTALAGQLLLVIALGAAWLCLGDSRKSKGSPAPFDSWKR